jgi:hypothetical protein
MNFWNCQISPENIFLLAQIDPDCQVNSGCNLKWKPADKSQIMLATVAIFRNKLVSKLLT